VQKKPTAKKVSFVSPELKMCSEIHQQTTEVRPYLIYDTKAVNTDHHITGRGDSLCNSSGVLPMSSSIAETTELVEVILCSI
jgi:hypothetical protein